MNKVIIGIVILILMLISAHYIFVEPFQGFGYDNPPLHHTRLNQPMVNPTECVNFIENPSQFITNKLRSMASPSGIDTGVGNNNRFINDEINRMVQGCVESNENDTTQCSDIMDDINNDELQNLHQNRNTPRNIIRCVSNPNCTFTRLQNQNSASFGCINNSE